MPFGRRQLIRSLSAAFATSLFWVRGRSALAAQAPSPLQSANLPAGAPVERVTGIGGFFFRAHDPKALGLWYQQHLGVGLTPTGLQDAVWQQEAGQTLFAPFKETSTYFGDPQKVWMLNFRVRDLQKMAAQLEAAGIPVKIDPEVYPNGRFARIHDPEGNPIELWQPKG